MWPYVLSTSIGLGLGFGGPFIYGFVKRRRQLRKERATEIALRRMRGGG